MRIREALPDKEIPNERDRVHQKLMYIFIDINMGVLFITDTNYGWHIGGQRSTLLPRSNAWIVTLIRFGPLIRN